MAKTQEEITELMYNMVKEAQGIKKLKPMDLTKAMKQILGDDYEKKACKLAIKTLIDSQRCVYTYFGGSFIELPHREGAAND
jgi:hypothetical protein